MLVTMPNNEYNVNANNDDIADYKIAISNQLSIHTSCCLTSLQTKTRFIAQLLIV